MYAHILSAFMPSSGRKQTAERKSPFPLCPLNQLFGLQLNLLGPSDATEKILFMKAPENKAQTSWILKEVDLRTTEINQYNTNFHIFNLL